MNIAAYQPGRDQAGHRELIQEYYRRIDAVDTDWVLALFAPDAVYQRADATYEGIDALTRFFGKDRQIRGAHVIQHMWTDEDSLVAIGEFTGRGAAGDARQVRFADMWAFNADGLVKRRQTYLAIGHAYVER